NARFVRERSHRHVHVGTVPDDGEEQRAARRAAGVFSSSSPTISRVSAPFVISSFSRSMPAKDLNAVPVAARQREQWQFAAYRNASATRYLTAPHQQPPMSRFPASLLSVEPPGMGLLYPRFRSGYIVLRGLSRT